MIYRPVKAEWILYKGMDEPTFQIKWLGIKFLAPLKFFQARSLV